MNISSLPDKPGVYLLKNKVGQVIYIGKSINIKNRVKAHLNPAKSPPGDRGASPLLAETAEVRYILTANEPEALIQESEMIKKYQPKYNIMLRDDKQYFYVVFTREKLPRITLTHQPGCLKIKNCKIEDSTHFAKWRNDVAGPFTDGKSLKIVLRYLRKIFPYYTQGHRKLPCPYCHLDLCPGPNPDIVEYKKNIKKLKDILNCKKPRVLSSLKKEMAQYAKNLEFEKATKVREQVKALENIFEHKSKIQTTNGETNPKSKSKKLKNFGFWDLDFEFLTLEAYDISNIQGREPVASMVRFDNGNPNKSMYRRFKIRLPERPNDFAMMREVISRRLGHPEWPYPDVFLIDGGRGQLNAAFDEIRKFNFHNIPYFVVVALAKRFNELYILGRKNPLPLGKLPRETKNLLMHARDEAHRFAISYHRTLHRRKTML